MLPDHMVTNLKTQKENPKKKFYLVFCLEGAMPVMIHLSYADVMNEAKRLAELPTSIGKHFYVMESQVLYKQNPHPVDCMFL